MKRDRIKSDMISLIHLGIEPETMKRDNKLRSKIRNEFGINETDVVIGNVARMVEMKGQEYLIKAFSLLNSANAKLIVVGNGKLEKKLHKLAETLGIKDKVIFPGFRDDMQAIYSAFDIYAHTSVEGGGETFPYAVLYALAQELPVVVTQVGDVPAMVATHDLRAKRSNPINQIHDLPGAERRSGHPLGHPIDETNGFVVPDKNPEEIAEKLRVLLEDNNLREKMGRASLEHLKKNFTVEKMTDSIEAIYNKVIHTNKK